MAEERFYRAFFKTLDILLGLLGINFEEHTVDAIKYGCINSLEWLTSYSENFPGGKLFVLIEITPDQIERVANNDLMTAKSNQHHHPYEQ